MAGHGRKNCDDALLLALAAGASTATAATQAKCSERTVRRRLADPAFREQVGAMRSQLIQDAVGRLAMLGTRAADELDRLIQQGENDQVKLGASRAVLGFMLQGHEHEVLARQIEELRQRLEERTNGTGNAAPDDGEDEGQAPNRDGESSATRRDAGKGSGADDDSRGDEAGRLANEALTLPVDASIAPLFPASG
jgi:hypothetical protein